MNYVCPECGEAGEAGACPRDQVAREAAGTDTLLGTTIGSWRIARLIGTGGMGRVYAAVQPAIGARVAIKVLRRDVLEDAGVVERFFGEASAVNVIKHENIIDIIDLARLPDGSPYIVMEFLDGASLGAILRRDRKLPLGALARIAGEVLAALAAAHAKGIVHRDLKPDNIFVSPSGRATVLDFGIAKLVRPEASGTAPTQTGSLLGTPQYMAPEQARAQPVDGRADLYALGVILYEAATGAPPFAADNMFDVLRLHVEAAPTPPREREPAIPPAFEAVILRALAKDPADRFASADEMREALVVAAAGLPDAALAPLPTPRRIAPTGSGAETQQSLARGETLPSSPPAPRATATPTIQLGRKAFVAILVGAALLGLGGAAIAIVVMRRDESPPARRDEPPPPPPPPHEAVVDPPVAAPPDAPILAAAPVDAALPHRAQPAFTQLPDGAFRVELPSRNPDPFTSYAYVRAQAEAIGKGAVRLSYMTWHHLDPKTGRVTAAIDHAVAEYQFVSSARAARGEPCYVLVDMSPNDLRVAFGDAQHDPSCKRDGVAPPRCNFAQLRAKAEALGLPKDSTAPITLAHNTAEGWQFSAGDFSEYIDDDCP